LHYKKKGSTLNMLRGDSSCRLEATDLYGGISIRTLKNLASTITGINQEHTDQDPRKGVLELAEK